MEIDKTRFQVKDINEAKNIILTPHEGKTTFARWEYETPFIMDIISKCGMFGENSLFLDYGCGIGRIAKELIKKYNCFVIGVDDSKEMQKLSIDYVDSKNFVCFSVELFDKFSDQFCFDFAYSIWTLQHILNVRDAIESIKYSLDKIGKFLVVNMTQRCLPTKNGWENDYLNIQDCLLKQFELEKTFEFDNSFFSDWYNDGNFKFFSEWYKKFAFINLYKVNN